MEFLTLCDFRGNSLPAVCSTDVSEVASVEKAAQDAHWVIALWTQEDALDALWRLAPLGARLIVLEPWQMALPDAALLISSAISGGWLRQRFQELAHRQCWLALEPMQHRFPLPCPDGQGEMVSPVPQAVSFYSEALCCRYCHAPGELFLFDTEETLFKKRQLAEECGFVGYLLQKETVKKL